MDDARPEPELPTGEDRAGDERTVLTEMLDYFRIVLLRKTWGLTDEELSVTLPPSDLSLGGLLLHMALVEDIWFDRRCAGRPEREPWASVDWEQDPDREFHVAADLTHAEIVAQFETSVARSREVMAGVGSLDELSAVGRSDGGATAIRWIMNHMIEEYARHCGHADLIRQSIDGRTGD